MIDNTWMKTDVIHISLPHQSPWLVSTDVTSTWFSFQQAFSGCVFCTWSLKMNLKTFCSDVWMQEFWTWKSETHIYPRLHPLSIGIAAWIHVSKASGFRQKHKPKEKLWKVQTEPQASQQKFLTVVVEVSASQQLLHYFQECGPFSAGGIYPSITSLIRPPRFRADS